MPPPPRRRSCSSLASPLRAGSWWRRPHGSRGPRCCDPPPSADQERRKRMRSTLESTLPWWIAGPVLGLVIVSLLGLANKRFGVLGGVTDLVQGSTEGRGLRSWRALLLVGIVLGGLAYTLLAGAPDAGTAYSWLDAH